MSALRKPAARASKSANYSRRSCYLRAVSLLLPFCSPRRLISHVFIVLFQGLEIQKGNNGSVEAGLSRSTLMCNLPFEFNCDQ